MELEGKLSIVTGGSRGIGKGISESLAKEGSDLAIIYRKNVEAFEAVESSLGALGVRVKGYQLNITNYEDVKKVFNQIYNDFGSIDILVNCAGRAPSTSSVYNSTIKEWHAILDIDLHAVYYCCKAVLEYMQAKKSGNIVNISSIVASTCHAGSAPYAAAKAGLEALTMVLAREEACHGIRVNAIAPGLINTDMSNQMSIAYGNERIKMLSESIPMQRFGEPDDIGNLVAYVASSKGNFITGQTLGVNGGQYYWQSCFADL